MEENEVDVSVSILAADYLFVGEKMKEDRNEDDSDDTTIKKSSTIIVRKILALITIRHLNKICLASVRVALEDIP
jgi:hypothetical protein